MVKNVKIDVEIEENIYLLKLMIHGNFITQGIAAACELGVFDSFKDLNIHLTLVEISGKTESNPAALKKKLLNFLLSVDLLSMQGDLTKKI